MNELLNPWTAQIAYHCGHIRQTELPNGRERTYSVEQSLAWMQFEASFECVDCQVKAMEEPEYVDSFWCQNEIDRRLGK